MDSNVANEVDPKWEAEEIPNEDFLFMRIHQNFVDEDGEPIPQAFRNQPPKIGGMSTDWQKYSTASETRSRARQPAENIIIELLAGAVRQIPSQSVVHTPDVENNNRAHTDVFGEKKPVEVRERFMQIYRRVPLDGQ
jgi:hypothetical protein